MSTRARLATLVAAMALVALALGFVFRSDDYALSLLVGLGTTLALAFPLFWLEHKFEERVATEVKDQVGVVRKATDASLGEFSTRLEEVRSSVGAIGDRVAELDREMQDRAGERQTRRHESALKPIVRVADDSSFQTIFDALRHSAESGATARAVHVPLEDQHATLRFVPSLPPEPAAIVITVIPDGFQPKTHDYDWVDGQSLDDALLELDEALQTTRGAGAPRVYTSGSIRDHLYRTLETAQERRLRTGTDAPPFPMVELPTEHWLITTRTLEHVTEPIAFDLSRVLATDAPPTGQPDQGELPYAWAMAHARFIEN